MSNTFIHICSYWQSGGLLLIPLAVTCIGIWICFLRTYEVLNRTAKDALEMKSIMEAYVSESNNTFALISKIKNIRSNRIANIICYVVAQVKSGISPMEAFLTEEKQCTESLRKDFILLAVFTGASPLLGLLGTVMGMMETFEAVSFLSGDTQSRIATGISRALITTQFGLFIALPGFFGLAYLQKMLNNISVLMAYSRTHMLMHLEVLSKGVER